MRNLTPPPPPPPRNRERTEKIVSALNIKVLPRDLRSRDTQSLLTTIFSQWLPLSTCVLLAIIGQLPPPTDAQRIRIPKMLYPDIRHRDNEPLQPTNDVEKALYECDASPDAPVVAYVSKMFAVPSDLLPENKRKQLTAEEMRERGRRQRELRAQNEGNPKVDQGVPLENDPSLEKTVQGDAAEEEEEEAEKEVVKEEHIIGFARLYSGTIRVGQKLYVLGPKYDPKYPDKHCSEITVKNLYLIMGRELEALPQVTAGNVFGIGGLEGHILKNGTLASTKTGVKNMVGVRLEASPIVRVALEPVDPGDMDKLVEGLRLLNQADPCVEVLLQETGEHVILTAGELHLERCLRDLKERFAKIDIHVSPPIVPFRESIVRAGTYILDDENRGIYSFVILADLPANKEKDGAQVPRGTVELQTSSKDVILKVRTVPLPARVTDFLIQNAATIKSIMDQKAARRSTQRENDIEESIAQERQIRGEAQADTADRVVSIEEFQSRLRHEFAEAQKEGGPLVPLWDNIVDQ